MTGDYYYRDRIVIGTYTVINRVASTFTLQYHIGPYLIPTCVVRGRCLHGEGFADMAPERSGAWGPEGSLLGKLLFRAVRVALRMHALPAATSVPP